MKKITLLASLLFSIMATSQIIYVDQNAIGLNDGSSWADAFIDLQDAVDEANFDSALSELYIAEGTYFPSIPSGRDATFNLTEEILLFGGFSPANGAIDLATRDFRLYETTLNGDIGTIDDSSDNAYTVVTITSPGVFVLIDGIHIEKGNANELTGTENQTTGGAIFKKDGSATLSLSNCTLSENNSFGNGGAIYADNVGALRVNNTIFDTNTSEQGRGGAVHYNMGSNSSFCEFRNNLFINNYAQFGGGAFFLRNTNPGVFLNAQFFNTTFSGNTATAPGDIGYTNNTGPITLRIGNSILWNNDDDGIDDIFQDLGTPITQEFSYSLIEGVDLSATNGLDGTNPANDPLYTNPAGNDFTLQNTSPVLDRGANFITNQVVDLNGAQRIQDGDGDGTDTIDFGAYEVTNPICTPLVDNRVYVDINATGNGDGSNWANAINQLYDGIALAETCNIPEIWVAEGTYFPKIINPGLPRIHSFVFNASELTLIGGFSPGNGAVDLATRDFRAYQTILSGDIGVPNDNSDNAYTVIRSTDLEDFFTMDGFYIEDGNSNSTTQNPNNLYSNGGGWFNNVFAESSNPNLKNIVFRNNNANFYGGGYYGYSQDNSAGVQAINVTFQNNSSGQSGAGFSMSTNGISQTVTTNFTNCLFADNSSGGNGGAFSLANDPAPVTEINIINCTFANNTASGDNSVIFTLQDFNDEVRLNINNSIVYSEGTTDDVITHVVNNPNGLYITNFEYSLIRNIDLTAVNGLDGTDPANTPLYTNPSNGDYTLQLGSPAIDVGDNSIVTQTEDLAGMERQQDGDGNGTTTVDLGAYEAEGCVVTITCPLDQAADADANCEFILPDYSGLATATNTCGTLSITQLPIAGTVVNAGTTTITLIASDGMISESCTFDLLVNDVTPPVLTCPGDQFESFNEFCEYILTDYTTMATAADACDPNITLTQSPPAGSVVFNSTIITITATDADLNSGSCSFELFLDDTTPPEIACPTDKNESLDGNCEFILPDYTGLASVFDSCDPFPNVTQDPAPGTIVSVTTSIILTATDANLNEAVCSFDVILADTIAPTITCPGDQTESLDANCEFVLPDYTGLATVMDVCDPNPTITQTPVAGTIISNTTTITLVVTDASSNSNSCTFDVIPEDTTPPTITCPGDQNETFDANCEFILPDYTVLATVNDTCDANPLLTQSPAPGTVITTTTIVTITATDVSLNTNDCTFSVIPEDTTAPTISCPGDQNESLDMNCEFIIPDYTGLVIVTDGCDPNPLLTQSPIAGTIISATTTITIFAEDATGNTNSCVFDVFLEDTTAPTITCPGDQNESVDATCQFVLPDYTGLALVTDSCDPAPVVSQNPPAGTIITGATIVTLLATDASTNSNSCTFNVIPEDTTAPTLTCPSDQNGSLDGTCEFILPDYTAFASVTDTCDPNPSLTQTPAPGTIVSATTVITLVAMDANGNSDNCSFNVILNDTIPPTLSCPADQIESVGAGCMFTIPDYTGLATATDNCGTVTLTQNPSPGTIVGTGITIITLDASDGSNTTSCTFMLTVEDTTPPLVVCQDITVQLDSAGLATITSNDVDNGSTDNCGITSLSLDQENFDCSNVGVNTITLTATDAAGNSTTCTSIITVEDTVAPTVSCQDITVQLDANGMVFITPAQVDNGSIDACGIQSLTLNTTVFDCSNLGQNTVTLTATDVHGNSTSCTSIVTVETTNGTPVAICQNITIPLQADGTATITPADIDGGSTGSSCANGFSIDIDNFDCTDIGTPVQVTLTVDNGNGSTDSCIALIHVVDSLDPSITCPEDQIIPGEKTPYVLPDYVALGEVFAEDNCLDITNIVQNPPAGTLLDIGAYNINFTATDPSDNEASCSFRLTIETLLEIPAQKSLTSITVFPNPANDFINITNPNNIELETVQLYDITGRLVKTLSLDTTVQHHLDISEIASATYFMIITAKNGEIMKQIVKE